MSRFTAQASDKRYRRQHHGADNKTEHQIQHGRHDRRANAAEALRPVFDRVMQRRDAMHHDAAAHEEHRDGAEHRQRFHQPRRRDQQPFADAARQRTNSGGSVLGLAIAKAIVQFRG